MQHKTGPEHKALSVGVLGDGRGPAALPQPTCQCWICAPEGMFVPAPFPHTGADSVHKPTLSTSSRLVLPQHTLWWNWAHSHWERRAFCPLPPADGLGTAGGHSRSRGSGQAWRVPTCPSPVLRVTPRTPPVQEGCWGSEAGSASGLCCRPGELGGIIWCERHKLCWVVGLMHRKCWS